MSENLPDVHTIGHVGSSCFKKQAVRREWGLIVRQQEEENEVTPHQENEKDDGGFSKQKKLL